VSRALRAPIVLAVVLALLAGLAATATSAQRAPRQMLDQQFQAVGDGQVTLEGSFAVLGMIDPSSRRTQFRVVDRAGDATIMFEGRSIPFGRNRQARLRDVVGNYYVRGTRFTIEVRGIQSVSATGVGSARMRGQGTYAIVDGPSGVWNNRRLNLGIRTRNVRRPIADRPPAMPLPPPDPTPAPAPQPEPAPAPAPAPGDDATPVPAPPRTPEPSRPPAGSTTDAIGVILVAGAI